ncbi:MAG: hemerythrin domain-containing protein [Gammaproteobacteria bacterium]|nr:hemerythrin domain-containing protein [Gammaproteobacteria bacterium]
MSLATQFAAHHRLLDQLWDDTQTRVAAADWPGAGAAFGAFRAAIERHMRTEEQILFPAYEEVHGADNPLTSILRKGHKDLRSFFDEIGEAVETADGDEAAALIGTTGQILLHHDAKEEEELYPAVDRLLPQAAADKAARQLEPPN